MLNSYQWAAVAAALFLPSIVLAATRKKATAENGSQNVRAFLLTIQFAEGTHGPNAYRTLYGGGLFASFEQHPNQAITRWGITSTAAGAYGFLYSTWKTLSADLSLPDFYPACQDKAAIELIRRKGALHDVVQGAIAEAIYKCRKVWASFPGAGYGQHERKIEDMLRFYVAAGGRLTIN